MRVDHEIHAIRVRALIDTGAPRTVFGRAVAEAVGLEVGRPDAATITVQMLGRPWRAEAHVVGLTLPPFDDIAWETEALFLRDHVDLPFEGLLGTIGFLDRWVVTFNYYDGQFIVEERDSFRARLPIDVEREFLDNYDSEWMRPGTE